MASLEFHVSAENRDFLNKMKQVQDKAAESIDKVEKEGKELDFIFGKIGMDLAALGAGFTATKLVSDIVRVRGEFQQLEIAMETMLGSQEKATALMSQLTATAAKTPFGLTDIAQGAKQLLAYGTASEEVNETLVRLGNIASGLTIPLNDLVYLYGTTMTQGRLFTQDLRQFMGRGIPLADELAKQFGVTKNKIGELVTEGKVGFPEVEKAIRTMTDEGGKFYNLMEKQSSSLTGQISNLEDAWDMMLNEIGTKTQDIASGSIQTVSWLIENYEKVGRVVLEIAGIYGTYKAALAVCTAVQKVNTFVMEEAAIQIQLTAMAHHNLTVEQAKAIARTNLLTLAKQRLLTTMKGLGKALTNPYVLAAAAVTALGFGIYKLATTQSEAEAAQRKLNDALSEASVSAGSEIKKLDELKGRLAAAKKGSAEYYEVKDEIVKNFGKYDSTLEAEIERVGDLSSKYDALTTAIQNSANARMYDKYVEEETERYDKDLSGKLTKLREKLYGKEGLGSEDAARTYSKIWKSIFQGEALDEETENIINSFDEQIWVYDKFGNKVKTTVNSIRDYIRFIEDANAEHDAFINNAKETFGIGANLSDFNSGLKKLTEDELKKTKTELTKVLAKFKATKEEQAYSLVSGEDITFSTEQQINDAIANVDAYLEQIKAKRAKNKPADDEPEKEAIKKAESTAKKVADAAGKAEYNLKKAQTEDEIKLIELERDFKIQALKDELAAYKAIYEAAGKQTDTLEEQYARMIDVEKKLADVEISNVRKEKAKKDKESLDELLKEFETYQQAVERIEKEYNEKKKKMYESDGVTFKPGFSQDNINELEKQKKEAIEDLAETYAAKTDAFESWADSLSSIALEKLKQMLILAKAQLQILKNTEGVDELEIAQAEAAIASLDAAISNSGDTTEKTKVKWTDLSKTLSDSATVFKELGSIFPGVAGEILSSIGSIATSAVEVANGIEAVGDAVTAAEKASAILAVVSAVIKAVTFFTNAVEDNRKANLASMKAVDDYKRSLEELADQKLKEKYENAFGRDSLGLIVETAKDANEELINLKDSLNDFPEFDFASYYMKNFDGRGWAKLSKKVRDKIGEIKDAGDMALVSDMRTGWQKYWGGGMNNLHVASLSDFIDESGILDTQGLSDWLDAYGEGLSDETYNAVESMIKDWERYEEKVKEINGYVQSLFGDISSSVADAMIDSWINTGNAIADAKSMLGQYAKTMAKAVIESKLLSEIFTDQASKDISDLIKVGDVDGAISMLSVLLEQANELAPAINEYLTGVDNLTGGAVSSQGKSEREAYKNEGITASQESVDKVDARLTTMQGHTYSISESCKIVANNSSQMVSRLTAIERNTSFLAAISEYIKALSSDIEDIKKNGIPML